MIVRFALGTVVATPGALDLLQRHEIDPRLLLARHVAGNWGVVDEEDREQNESAVDAGLRILSAYTLGGGERLWIITEADRSVTTVLTPDEY